MQVTVSAQVNEVTATRASTADVGASLVACLEEATSQWENGDVQPPTDGAEAEVWECQNPGRGKGPVHFRNLEDVKALLEPRLVE